MCRRIKAKGERLVDVVVFCCTRLDESPFLIDLCTIYDVQEEKSLLGIDVGSKGKIRSRHGERRRL